MAPGAALCPEAHRDGNHHPAAQKRQEEGRRVERDPPDVSGDEAPVQQPEEEPEGHCRRDEAERLQRGPEPRRARPRIVTSANEQGRPGHDGQQDEAQPLPAGHGRTDSGGQPALADRTDVVDAVRELVVDRHRTERHGDEHGSGPVSCANAHPRREEGHPGEAQPDERQGIDPAETERPPQQSREAQMRPPGAVVPAEAAQEGKETGQEQRLRQQLGQGEPAEEHLRIERRVNHAQGDGQGVAAEAPSDEEEGSQAEAAEQAHQAQVGPAPDGLQPHRQPHRKQVVEVERDHVPARRDEGHSTRQSRVGTRVVALEPVPQQSLALFGGHLGDQGVVVPDRSLASELVGGCQIDGAVAAGDRGVEGREQHPVEDGEEEERQAEGDVPRQPRPRKGPVPASPAPDDARRDDESHGRPDETAREKTEVRQEEEARGQDGEARQQ